MRRSVLALTLLLASSATAFAQTPVHFPQRSGAGELHGDVYGSGTRAVILVHGGSFHKESWAEQARDIAAHGFLVLALALRGDHNNPDGTPGSFGSADENRDDVLAAMQYLHQGGAKEIDAVGGSLGGDAVGDADVVAPGALSRIVILASDGGSQPERLNGRKLFILARDDRSGSGPRLPEIQEHYNQAPQPKQLILLKGSAHAQFLFATDQGPRLLSEIERFLTEK